MPAAIVGRFVDAVKQVIAIAAIAHDRWGPRLSAKVLPYLDRDFPGSSLLRIGCTDLARSLRVEVDEKPVPAENITIAGTVTRDQVRQIAETKMPDLNAIDIDGAMLQVEGTARSMGIKVTG